MVLTSFIRGELPPDLLEQVKAYLNGRLSSNINCSFLGLIVQLKFRSYEFVDIGGN